MGKFPVTQEQYQRVMGVNPSVFQGQRDNLPPAAGEKQGRRPVENLNWYDALVFCNRLSMQEGLRPVYSIRGHTDPAQWGPIPELAWNPMRGDNELVGDHTGWSHVRKDIHANGWRLPTEAEWEYAARAGTTTAFYTGDNDWQRVSHSIGWFGMNTDRTREVGKKPPNPWGLFDMMGNVWELCWDQASDSYGHGAPRTDPLDPPSGWSGHRSPPGMPPRIARGGTWECSAQSLRSASRNAVFQWERSGNVHIGLRVARNASD